MYGAAEGGGVGTMGQEASDSLHNPGKVRERNMRSLGDDRMDRESPRGGKENRK